MRMGDDHLYRRVYEEQKFGGTRTKHARPRPIKVTYYYCVDFPCCLFVPVYLAIAVWFGPAEFLPVLVELRGSQCECHLSFLWFLHPGHLNENEWRYLGALQI